MAKLRILAILPLLFAASTSGQTAATPYLPNITAGAGASFFNPGASGSVDFDKQAAANSQWYFHLAIGNITVQQGKLYAVIRPGMEYRAWSATNNLVGAALAFDGGFATGQSAGTSTALTSFTGDGYGWWDVFQTFKGLKKLGHGYLEVGGSVQGGTIISTQTNTPIQFVPTLKFRLGF